MKRELEPKQGADFDRCYTFMAVGAHMHAADTMEVFRNYSSDKLGAVISEGEKTVKMHLDHAKQLAKKLEGKSGSPSDLDKKDKKDKHDKDPIEGTNPPPPRKK